MVKRSLFCLLAILMLVVAACSNWGSDPNAKGDLRIEIINQKDMELKDSISSVKVTVANSNYQDTKEFNNLDDNSVSNTISEIPVGSYDVDVEAKNSDGNIVKTSYEPSKVIQEGENRLRVFY